MPEGLPWEWWGEGVPYARALSRQRRRREEVISGESTECLALLEHTSVITVGRRPAPGTPSAQVLAAAGIDHCQTERGGLATWHGPGQLVGYLILDVRGRGIGVKGLVAGVESGLMDWLSSHGLCPTRRCGFPGVWIESQKIAALGFHFRRGVSMHGFALNLNPSLEGFKRINPCGLAGVEMTSMATLLGTAPTPRLAAASVARSIQAALGLLDGGISGVKVGQRLRTPAGA